MQGPVLFSKFLITLLGRASCLVVGLATFTDDSELDYTVAHRGISPSKARMLKGLGKTENNRHSML